MDKEIVKHINFWLLNKFTTDYEPYIKFINRDGELNDVFKEWNFKPTEQDAFARRVFQIWDMRISSEDFTVTEIIREELVWSFLHIFPRASKKAKKNQFNSNNENLYLYHYSCFMDLIKTNGMRPSNFLNNRNDQDEVIHLMDRSSLPRKKLFKAIYDRAVIKKYNSFAYMEIDDIAKKHYISSCLHEKNCNECCMGLKKENRLEISLKDFIDSWKDSKISNRLYYGYVRYDYGTKYNVYDFISKILIPLLKKKRSSLGPLIEELISIVSTFVKKSTSVNGYEYYKEREFRFLYASLKADEIPNHYIPLTGRSLKYRKITK